MSAVGVIFDLDNTLIQSEIDFAQMARALVDRLVARVGPHSIPPDMTDKTIAQMIEDARRLSPDEDLTEELWDIVGRHEARGMVDVQLESGAEAVVNTLRAFGHPMAICTNNSGRATIEALAVFGEPTPFHPIITRDDVQFLKPSPEGLFLIKDAWSALELRHILFVGDSWLDGKAAEEAGIPFVKYKSLPDRLQRDPVPTLHEIERLRELLDIVRDMS